MRIEDSTYRRLKIYTNILFKDGYDRKEAIDILSGSNQEIPIEKIASIVGQTYNSMRKSI